MNAPLVRIADVVEPVGTVAPGTSPDTMFTYIDISTVDNGLKVIREPRRILGREAPSRARQPVRAGDILVATTRPYLNAVAMVPDALDGAVCSTGFAVLRPNGSVDAGYMYLFVRSPAFIQPLAAQVQGALYPAVSDRDVLEQRIPLPRLEDQRRIAAEVRHQLKAVESASSIARTSHKAIKQLRDASLRSAFESGGASRWPRARLGNVCEFVSDGTHQPPQFAADGIPFLFVRNIVGGRIDLETDRHVSVETYEELTRRRRPARGDVLYSAVGSFGVAVVVETDRPFTFQRHIAHLRLRTDIASPDFVAAYINSPSGNRQSDSVAMGGAQRTVTLGALASFDLPLPPIDDQLRVAAELREQLALIDDIEASTGAEREAIDALPAALLRRAFEDLVA